VGPLAAGSWRARREIGVGRVAIPAKVIANHADPQANLDKIEAAQARSRGETVRIDPDGDVKLKTFTGWKLDLMKMMNKDRRLKPDSYARVGNAILPHVNQHTYEAFPSLPTIANESALGISTVKKAVVLLAELGYFTIVKRGRNNFYRFPPDLALISALEPLVE
jgi:hypothetical protein